MAAKKKPAAKAKPAPKLPVLPPAKPSTPAAALAAMRKAGVGRLLSTGAGSDVSERIPSGLSVLDWHIIGGGGLPVGRVCELAGDEGTGKTSLAFAFIGGCQRIGTGVAQLCESEKALQAERAAAFGVDLDGVLLAEPDTLEGALTNAAEFMEQCIRSGVGPNLWVYDSLAAGIPAAELAAGVGGNPTMGLVARIMSQKLRMLLPLATRSRTAILVVNQTRMKLGMVFGNPTTTTGGNALKFYSSTRLMLMGGTSVKDGTESVGKDVTITCIKNKGKKPFAKGRVRLMYDEGWSEAWSLLNHAKDVGAASPGAKGGKAYTAALAKLGWPAPIGAGAQPESDRAFSAVAEDAAAPDDKPDAAFVLNPNDLETTGDS